MKKFALNLIVFLLPLTLLMIMSLATEWHIFRRSMRNPGCRIAAFGDSIVQCSLNEKRFPGLVNFGMRSTPPVFWKFKLQTALEENPQIEIVVIEINPFVWFSRAEDAASSMQFARGHLPEIAMVDVMRWGDLGKPDVNDLVPHLFQGVVKPFAVRCVEFSSVCDLQSGFSPRGGTLARLNGLGVDKDIADIVPFHGKDDSGTFNQLTIESCIVLAKKADKRVIIMTAPIWSYYLNHAFKRITLERYSTDMKRLSERYGCLWLDYSHLEFKDEEWSDYRHLNVAGSDRLTERFKNDVEQMIPYRKGE